ncbi:esterase/lipase family protein [Kitasatospora xanthocidica]|uniref:esterase/lipase family protein n=1 Tax=Kitasatospora xanthocidica TaxID=83382 RepID=UPI0019B6EE85|nr:alpha/beta fold hydrolase [Kitasatospora xanthocidica]GHF81191.1 lipase [Kitasatospora xanthocidica]
MRRRLGGTFGAALLAGALLAGATAVPAGAAPAVAAGVEAAGTDAAGASGTALPPDGDTVASPPGANDWTCRPSAAHPDPVVLVHGTFANRYENWLALSPLLKSLGYCVFALDYGMIPGVTSSGSGLLLPIGGLGPVPESAAQLARFVDLVRNATGAAKVDIVGHSQGGMLPNYYLKFLGGASKVGRLVGLAPSNHGTTLDGIVNLAPYFPGVRDLIYTVCQACRDQAVGSDFNKTMASRPDTVPGVRYTVISTVYDEVVTPWRTQFLNGPDVDNVVLQNHCPISLAEHVAIAFSPTALHLVTNALDPAHATPALCG